MKRAFICFISVVLILVTLCSCGQEKEFVQKVVDYHNCFEFVKYGKENESLVASFDDVPDPYILTTAKLIDDREETDFTAETPDYYGVLCATSGEYYSIFLKIYFEGEKVYTEVYTDNSPAQMIEKGILYCPNITVSQFEELLSFTKAVKT